MTVQQLVWKVLPAAIPALMAAQVPPLTASAKCSCLAHMHVYPRSRDPFGYSMIDTPIVFAGPSCA